MTAPTDLCLLADVKSSIPITSSTDDGILQRLITWSGLYWLERTGRDTIGAQKSFTEVYDGNGARRIFLRNFPIVSVASLSVDSRAMQASMFAVDQSKKSLVIAGNYSFGSTAFCRGVQNVSVTYTAGYAAVPANIAEASCRQVVYWYKSSRHLDQSSVMAGEGNGSTSYRSWENPPEVEREIQAQTRRSMS